MLEGLLLSSLTGGKLTQFSADTLKASLDESKLLSLEDFSALFLQQFPVGLEQKGLMRALVSEGKVLSAEGLALPQGHIRGKGLPQGFIESMLKTLSDPIQLEKLGLTEKQVIPLKDLLKSSEIKGITLPVLNEKINEFFKGKSGDENIGKLVQQFKDVQEPELFKEVVHDFLKSAREFNGKQVDGLMKTINFGQLMSANVQNVTPQNIMPGTELGLNPINSQLNTEHHLTRVPVNTQTVTVDTLVNKPQWAEAFNSKVIMLAKDNIQSAQIRLNPAELGPVEIRLNVNNDQTHIHFIAQHGDVREVIEDAFPRLKEMMGQSGVNLGDVNVSEHSASDEDNSFEEEFALNTEGQDSEDTAADEKQTQEVHIAAQTGFIDHYI